MEHSDATGKATGDPAKVIFFNGNIIAVDEIAFAYDAPSALGQANDGCQVEFKRKGSRFLYGISAEGLFSLIGGAPF